MNQPTDQRQEKFALDNCEREPVHIPGRVQSFAAVLGFDLKSFHILHYTENLAEITKSEILANPANGEDSILGRSLKDVIPNSTSTHEIRNALGLPTIKLRRERLGRFTLSPDSDQQFELGLSIASGTTGILEIQPASDSIDRTDSSVTQVRAMLLNLVHDEGVEKLLQSAVGALRTSTGFDRVMGYRFLPNDEGEVAAEALGPAIEPYLGLRYPAYDIPPQVRKIALRMPLRMIADINDPHVQVVSVLDEPFDLTMCHARGVSPIHLEYLSNMGVKATMNVAIIVRGELWGLFAFHHYRPKCLQPDQRSVCELFGELFSIHLQQELEKEILLSRKRASSTLNALRAGGEEVLEDSIERLWKDLAQTVNANGLALVRKNTVIRHGDVPDNDVVRAIIESTDAAMFSVDSFAGLADIPDQGHSKDQNKEQHKDVGKSTGVLALTIGPGSETWLAFFRNEIVHEIRWGGQPIKQLSVGPNGPRLHPRASFAEYSETVTGKCESWTAADLAAASELRGVILEVFFQDANLSNAQWRKQKEYQDLLIAELNHRVKNILALVRSISRQTKDSTVSLESYAGAFEKRIAALATAHDLIGGSGLQWAPIRDLLQTEVQPYTHSEKKVELSGPDYGLRTDVAPVVALVIHEMVSNSAKYGSLSADVGALSVKWSKDAGGIKILWQETGNNISAEPNRRGFGLSLIERAIPYECNGDSKVSFSTEGVSIELWLPGDAVLELAEDSGAKIKQKTKFNTTPVSAATLQRVLVVEDNMVLAMELEKIVKSMGGQHVDAVPSVKLGQRLLGRDSDYSLAIMDINLGETTSFELADKLVELKVPVIFVSGYDTVFDIPESLACLPRLAKPVDADALSQAIDSISR